MHYSNHFNTYIIGIRLTSKCTIILCHLILSIFINQHLIFIIYSHIDIYSVICWDHTQIQCALINHTEFAPQRRGHARIHLVNPYDSVRQEITYMCLACHKTSSHWDVASCPVWKVHIKAYLACLGCTHMEVIYQNVEAFFKLFNTMHNTNLKAVSSEQE